MYVFSELKLQWNAGSVNDSLAKVSHIVKVFTNNKSAGSDSIVGKSIKHRGKPMCELLLIMFSMFPPAF